MEEMLKILYVDDEVANLTNFKFLFQDDYIVYTASSAKEAIEFLSRNEVQIIISDQRMPDMTGIQFLGEVSKNKPETIRILLTAYTETQDIIDAINIGQVYQYITKPFQEQVIRNVLNKAAEIWELKRQNQELLVQLEEKNEEFEQANEELRQINEELCRAKDKAEESDRLKTAFLQNMSHEIRTPMNAIIGFSDFLNDPDLSDEKRKSFSSIIINSSNQLLNIVTDILTISSLETNQEKLNITKVCINNIIIELLSIFKPQAQAQNISFYSQQQLSNSESEVFTDRTKVTQILTNLLTNALKFTHEGYIDFGYEIVTELNSATQLPSEMLRFYVKDTGIGISKEQQIAIFERFRQADISINKKYGGTGLGLSISKGFVNLLQGNIWVNSELGKGSTFYFTIPYNGTHKKSEITNSEFKNPSELLVLVAEDEEYNYLLIEEFLMPFKPKILHAVNGEQAVQISKSNRNICLIIMDIKMPVLDGYSAALQIKEFLPDVPIIAQSAYALVHEKEKFKENAFNDYLTKPIKREEFKEIASKYLS